MEKLDEANLNIDRKAMEKLAAANGWTFDKEGGSHTLYRKEGSKEILAIPRHKGSFKPGTARQLVAIATGTRDRTVKEDEQIKPPERPEKLKLGKNKTKVKWNPEKIKEVIMDRIIKLVMETKADHVGQAYSVKDYNIAYSDPWAVLNDRNAPSSLKDLAYRVIQVRTESADQDYEEVIFEKFVREMNPEELAAHRGKQAKAKEYVAAHPIHHQHIMDSFDSANDAEREFGTNWYSDLHEHAKGLARESNVSMNQMSGLIANYSPQTHWGDNMVTAAKVARTKEAVGGMQVKYDDEGKKRGVFACAKQKESAQRILDGEDYHNVLKGHKVKAFGHLIEHGGAGEEAAPTPQAPVMGKNGKPKKQKIPDPPMTVCVDRHALSVATGGRVGDMEFGAYGLKSKARYSEAVSAYIRAADEINKRPENVAKGYKILPHQLQAITWLRQQRANGDLEAAESKLPQVDTRKPLKSGKARAPLPPKESTGSKTAKAGLAATARYNEYMAKEHPNLTSRQPGTGYGVHESLWGMFADEE